MEREFRLKSGTELAEIAIVLYNIHSSPSPW